MKDATEQITTLGQVIQTADNIDCEHSLYLPFDQKWGLETKALTVLLDSSGGGPEETEDDHPPEAAIREGLARAIGMDAVQDVVANLRQQMNEPTPVQLLEAFLFYYDNDAFIELAV